MNELSPLDLIDKIVNQAIEQDDPDIVFQQIRNLEEKKELIEAAKSKFFFTLDEVWGQFSVSRNESLYTQAFEKLNYHPHTIDRHITLWKHQGELPQSFQDRPAREKFVITKMLSQGYELDAEQREKLERTSTKAEVDAFAREVKGKSPRKGSLQLYLAEDGTLYGWMDDEREDFGYLNVHSKHPIATKAIARIKDSSGVLKK